MNDKETKRIAGRGVITGLILWFLAMPGSFVILLWLFDAIRGITVHP